MRFAIAWLDNKITKKNKKRKIEISHGSTERICVCPYTISNIFFVNLILTIHKSTFGGSCTIIGSGGSSIM